MGCNGFEVRRRLIVREKLILLFIAVFVCGCSRDIYLLPKNPLTEEQKAEKAKELSNLTLYRRISEFMLGEKDKSIFRREVIRRHPEWQEDIQKIIRESVNNNIIKQMTELII